MVLSSTDSGDAKSITDLILTQLTEAGLTSSKIRSQVYDDASVMVGHCGGVQRLSQEHENGKDCVCAVPEQLIACCGASNVG